MSDSDRTAETSRILDAIRAKRDRRSSTVDDIAELEASLIADIEAFDLNEAERNARREQNGSSGEGGVGDTVWGFPEIVPAGAVRHLERRQSVLQDYGPGGKDPQRITQGSSLLGQLRVQADNRQRELHSDMAQRSASSNALDKALKHMFFYLHALVQQLNIVKPEIPRKYEVAGDAVFSDLVWQEGFSDFRTQSQSAGAMVELVTLSYQLAAPINFTIKRDGPAVERLRAVLFDYGLQFTCNEFKNQRSYVERAEFEIRGQIGVSARWKADFAKGVLVLEGRNLERLGSASYTVRPEAVDQELLDEFGRLVLVLPNRFRALAKR